MRIFYFVHKGAHEKNAAPGSLHKVLRIGRVGHTAEIKTLATVAHRYLYQLIRAAEDDLDRFRFVLFIAVQDGVGDRLAHGHVNSEGRFLVKPKAMYDLRGHVGG